MGQCPSRITAVHIGFKKEADSLDMKWVILLATLCIVFSSPLADPDEESAPVGKGLLASFFASRSTTSPPEASGNSDYRASSYSFGGATAFNNAYGYGRYGGGYGGGYGNAGCYYRGIYIC